MSITRGAAEILFANGEHEEALCMLEMLANRQLRKFGPRSARTLKTRSRIASILVVQERYAEALKMLLDIYRIKLGVLGLKHPCTMDTRESIIDLFVKYGPVNVTSQDKKEVAKILRYLMKLIKKKCLKGLVEEALKEGLEISEDVVSFFGLESLMTLNIVSLVAMIYSTTEEYDYALDMIEDVYNKKVRLYGPNNRRLASTLMKKGSILLKMCDFEGAMKCYNEAHNIRRFVLGNFHRKTLLAMRGIAEVTYTVGNYEEALSLLTGIARFQGHYNFKEYIFTKLHTGILESDRGNYEDALDIFREIFIDIRTPKRIKGMIQNKKGALLTKLGRYYEARIVLNDAVKLLKNTKLYEELLSTYRNIAILLGKDERHITADAMFKMLLKLSNKSLKGDHSLTLAIENDQGEFFYSRGEFNEALKAFIKVWNFTSIPLGKNHPAALHAKCQVAKVFKAQGRHDEALRMYNEVLPALKAHYYPQHLQCIDIHRQIASIYLSRSSFTTAFEIYYKNYEILMTNYESEHPFMIEIIEQLQTFTDRVPLRRLIEATLMENFDQLRSFIEEGDDVNARDVNGAVTLHYASREGSIDIMRYLLSKGAIYEIEDMMGNTPESFAANEATMVVFLLVRRLFECIERNQLEQVNIIIRRERSIRNARDAEHRTPLQSAVAKGHTEIVKALVSEGADISLGSEDYGNVLHMAAERGHTEILDFLLEHLRSTDLDLFRNLIDSTENVMGATPLHFAAKKNKLGCVNVLIHYVANPTIKDALDHFPYDMGNAIMQQRILDYGFRFINRYS